MSDVAALNEQIARIKGCQSEECRANKLECPRYAHSPYWHNRKDEDGYALSGTSHWHIGGWPDYTQPTMWAGLLVELGEQFVVTIYGGAAEGWYIQLSEPSSSRHADKGSFRADDLGLAVCRAYVAAHLPAGDAP